MGLTNNLGKLSNMITSTGSNVGINGTPTAFSTNVYFDVIGNTTTQGGLIQSRNSDNSIIGSFFTNANGLNVRTETTHPMLFSTSATERMRITSTGSVLISTTTSASSILKLQVGDGTTDSRVYFNPSSQYALAFANSSSNAYYLGVATSGSTSSFVLHNASAGTNPLTITYAGNVGIGTSSPSSAANYRYLTIMGSSTTNGGVVDLRTSDSSSNTQLYTDNTGGQLNVTTAHPLLLFTNGTERMRITSGGNVGIGLTSPTGQLSIANQISNGANPVSSYAATSGVNGQNFFNGYYVVNSDGLGTYPRYFDIVSVGQPDGSNGGSNIRFFTNPIAINSPSVERLRITSGGYVRLASNGIQFNGDTSDANSLDDYEEGTFTPILAAESGGASYSSQSGWYTKIGRVVTITWFLSFTKNSLSGGTLRLTNFPFTLLNGGVFYPQGAVLLDNLSTTTNNITLQGANNSTGGDFIGGNGGTTNHVGLPITTLGSGTMSCRGTLTYFTS